jgi:hypothetical protein
MSEEKKVKYRYLVAEYYFCLANPEPANNDIGSTMIDTVTNPPILFKSEKSAKKYLKFLAKERTKQLKERCDDLEFDKENDSVYYACLPNGNCLYKCEIKKIIYHINKVPKFNPLSDINLEKVMRMCE